MQYSCAEPTCCTPTAWAKLAASNHKFNINHKVAFAKTVVGLIPRTVARRSYIFFSSLQTRSWPAPAAGGLVLRSLHRPSPLLSCACAGREALVAPSLLPVSLHRAPNALPAPGRAARPPPPEHPPSPWRVVASPYLPPCVGQRRPHFQLASQSHAMAWTLDWGGIRSMALAWALDCVGFGR